MMRMILCLMVLIGVAGCRSRAEREAATAERQAVIEDVERAAERMQARRSMEFLVGTIAGDVREVESAKDVVEAALPPGAAERAKIKYETAVARYVRRKAEWDRCLALLSGGGLIDGAPAGKDVGSDLYRWNRHFWEVMNKAREVYWANGEHGRFSPEVLRLETELTKLEQNPPAWTGVTGGRDADQVEVALRLWQGSSNDSGSPMSRRSKEFQTTGRDGLLPGFGLEY